MNKYQLPIHPYRVPGEHLTPREWIIDMTDKDLPIDGGWGYTKEDACIIDKNDAIVDPDISFDGVALEHEFVAARLSIEYYQAHRTEYPGITDFAWNNINQSLHEEEGRKYDELLFEVVVSNGDEQIRYKSIFWFDITSFYGQFDFEDEL